MGLGAAPEGEGRTGQTARSQRENGGGASAAGGPILYKRKLAQPERRFIKHSVDSVPKAQISLEKRRMQG